MKTSNAHKNGLLLVLLFFITSSISYSQILKKGPYLLMSVSNTEMQVLWQVDIVSTNQLQWGTDLNYSSGSINSNEYGTDHQHKYVISGLNAGVKYYYRLTVGSTIKTGSFIAAPPTNASSLKFFAYGDTRTNVADHNAVAGQMISAYTSDAAFQTIVVSMGDLVSNGDDENTWASEFFNNSQPNITTMLANLPYQSCIGNHEGTGVLFTKYFPYSFAGGRYYSFDYGPAHFAVVDQYTTYTVGSAQYNWLVNDLAISTKPWKFIYLHEPGWTAGGHANNTDVQTIIEPLCEQYDIPVVFAGHNHYYARAEVKQNGKQVQHITTGGGGAPLYTPDPLQPNIVATSASYHFCKINIVNQNVLQFEAITKDGVKIDEFTIDRTPPATVISNVQLGNITSNSALISWVTDISATSDVEYGNTAAYGLTASGTGGVTNHSVSLTGLQSNTLYHFRVKSNGVYSGDYSFQTLSPSIARYTPSSIAITAGTSSGQVGSLAANDNSYFKVNSTSSKPRKCEWEATFKITQTASEVNRFTLTYDGKYDRNITQSLYMYNYSSGSWVQINARSVSTKDITIQYIQNSPANFISSSGEIQVKVSSTLTSKNYSCYGDFMEIAVEVTALKKAFMETKLLDIVDVQNFNQDHFYNFPNPSQNNNTIHFELKQSSTVSVLLNDLKGNTISRILNDVRREKGIYEIPGTAESLPAGVYFYVLTIQEDTGIFARKLSKLIVLK